MKKIWIISDTHFGHKKLIEWGRPADFDEQIWRKFETQIKEGDVVIHLGDVCFGNDSEYNLRFTALKGRKYILVKGNHDNKSDSWYLDHGWDFVCESFSKTIKGKKVLFTHIPALKSDDYDFNFHGHTHGNHHRASDKKKADYDPTWHKDFSPELVGYAPMIIN